MRTSAHALFYTILLKRNKKKKSIDHGGEQLVRLQAHLLPRILSMLLAMLLSDNEPLMRTLSKLVNLNNPNLVLFVGEVLVGNDIVDQLSKFNQVIAPPNIVNKMLSVVTGNSSNMSDTLLGATSSCIPWRTTDPKYANNEVYVDLVEEMDAIVNRDGVLVKCEIYGEVQVNSHLSGVPDLTLSFANPSILDDIVLESCCTTFVEVQKRGKDNWPEFELYAAYLLVVMAVDIALVGMLALYARIGKPSRYLVINSILRYWGWQDNVDQ
ncbi:PREDICTED: AP-3 complex subunit [Prunus dulcis]|uniref:PREDICTED: AP-3 complex subunit n=1 Tax=Prunus dulcis TaxID=3755 RepID=A0A5E4GN96_PRUDU|nr:PREDICTED: AP-3 complex subunit [Prunus dulcis]